MRFFIHLCASAAWSAFLFSTPATAQTPTSCNLDHINLASLENVAVLAVGPPPTSDREIADATPALETQSPERAVPRAGLPSGGEVLGYTRLRIKYTSCTSKKLRSYDQESRSALERFFVGKVDNHVLKFDALVEPIGVKTSSQLYSMLRTSAKDGQSWTTEIRNDDFLLPYFRLDTASILNFTANFQSEGSSDVDIGGTILDIIERGSKFITPNASLITDKNKPRFNDAASFVDESLSKLFYKKVTETARQGVAIQPTTSSEHHLVRIMLVAPHPSKTYITAQKPGRVIGEWDIYADRLRKSLFVEVDDDDEGAANVDKLDSATVLNLKTSDGEILRDRLASSEAIGKAAQLLAKTPKDQIAGPAIGLCRLVATEAAKVGLAPFDLAIAAWAFLADQAMESEKHAAAHAACGAVRHFPA